MSKPRLGVAARPGSVPTHLSSAVQTLQALRL